MRQLLIEAEEKAKEVSVEIVKRGEILVPVMLVEVPSEKIIWSKDKSEKTDISTEIVCVHMPNIVKEAFADAIRQLLRKWNAFGYVFVIEAYITTSKRVVEENIPIHNLPADDRDDIIMIATVERNGEVKISTAVVIPTKEGRRVEEFKTLSDMQPGCYADGRMLVKNW